MFEYLNVYGAISLLVIFITVVIKLLRRSDSEDNGIGWKDIANIWDFLSNVPKWVQYYHTLNANEQVLRQKRDQLHERLEDLEMEVEHKEQNTNRLRKREVDNWLNSSRTKCSEVDILLQEISRETCIIFKYLYRAYLGSLVEIKIKEIDDLHNAGVFEEVLSCVRERVELLTITLVGNAANQYIERILTWLRSGVTKIGVHGIRGIGKTALMMHIHNQLLCYADVQVYMIQVSEDQKEKDLQGEIAKAVGIDLQEEDGLKRAALLYTALRKRKFVLILDGLTKHLLEDKIGIPLDATKGKMIITSRSLDVCRKTGCQNNMIAMDRLADEEALRLFKQKVERDFKREPEIEHVAQEIVDLCEGVPLRIVDKATDLRGEGDIRAWQENLNNM
ncbi:putative disease resistance protein At1g63350 [Beta vulgaris subsp. vulgaris]|uniref:putative disease resistance protein At1g63350 n=1 Tax=Beta vulgaris subsp. vulgaris TaxID=3555 RepID=UPI0020375C14|nr:putative disease resistance protein At1g63350 [Beta vulgaris subsp. vulgaris]